MTIQAAPSCAPAAMSTDSREHRQPSTDRPHTPVAHELRRAYELAKSLAEALEVANLRAAHAEAVRLREVVFEAWAALGDDGEVVPG